MPKKQVKVGHTTDDIVSPASEPEARWVLGQWAGYPMWRCTACQFDTTDSQDAIEQHWKNLHVLPVEAPLAIQVYDRRGNPVERSI